MERFAENRPIIRALYETSLKQEPSNKLAGVQKLEEKLEQIQLDTETLNANIKLSDGDSISTQYLQLKGKRDNVAKKRKYTTLELEQHKVRISADYKEYVTGCEIEIRNSEEEWKRKSDAIKSKIDYENLRHEKRVEQLNNELEITQGAAALEQDEFETNSRRELVDLNAEIRHRQQIKQDLELQIEQIQQQINYRQEESVLDVFKVGQIEELYEEKVTKTVVDSSKEPIRTTPKQDNFKTPSNISLSLSNFQANSKKSAVNVRKKPQTVSRKRKVKQEEDDITKLVNEDKRKNHPAVMKRTLFSMDDLDYLNDLPGIFSQSSDC